MRLPSQERLARQAVAGGGTVVLLVVFLLRFLGSRWFRFLSPPLNPGLLRHNQRRFKVPSLRYARHSVCRQKLRSLKDSGFHAGSADGCYDPAMRPCKRRGPVSASVAFLITAWCMEIQGVERAERSRGAEPSLFVLTESQRCRIGEVSNLGSVLLEVAYSSTSWEWPGSGMWRSAEHAGCSVSTTGDVAWRAIEVVGALIPPRQLVVLAGVSSFDVAVG